ncbi:MAG: phospholipid carrier-dependent glycosyltransferase, partial [Rhodanobacter sp.]
MRGVPEIVRRRLATLDDWLNPHSWMVTVVVVVIGAILRFQGLSKPKGYIFDEVYYPTDAWDMIHHGVEWDEKTNGPAYVVHPPLGKWLIALGELKFGNTELGWRFPAAVAGTLMILILIRVAYRMFHSVLLAGTAGLLMALDGFQLVLSRTSLLDIFLGLFVLASFAAMVLDRDQYRRRLLR